MGLSSFKEVSCSDCRFVEEEEENGEKVYLCLAKARRRIDPRVKKMCQRFFPKSDDGEKGLIEHQSLKSEGSNYFDLTPLYRLMQGR